MVFNAVHGRMPSVATGANVAQKDMIYIGVSGDGDTGSIGIGQFLHGIRRRLNILYIVENNGVYGLTKGQFSAIADKGAVSKKGETNPYASIDPVLMAIQLGAGFVARAFSGDKQQLIPLIKSGLMYPGFAVIDVVSPCVSFNNHSESTRSYDYAREHFEEILSVDIVPKRDEIRINMEPGDTANVKLHDGSYLSLKKIDKGFDCFTKAEVIRYIESHKAKEQIVTGLLYLDPNSGDMHDALETTDKPLRDIPYKDLTPSAEDLDMINKSHR